jgi:hypothetical protein
LTLQIQLSGEQERKLTIPVRATIPGGILKVTPPQIDFGKRRISDADRKDVQVDFQGHSDAEGLQIVSQEPAFLVIGTPIRIKPGIWQFTVELPSNHPDARRYQAEGLMEGRVVLRASRIWPTVAVRVRWQPPAR